MKRKASIQKWLENITILAAYDSIDIAYFNFFASLSLNYKNYHQRVDKRKFQKTNLYNLYGWVKDIGPKVFPSKRDSDLLGQSDNFLKVAELGNKNKKSFDQFLPKFDITRKKQRDLPEELLGKTWRYKGRMVNNFIEELMKLINQYDVHISEIFMIYHTITDRMNYQWTEGETPTIEIKGEVMYRVLERKNKNFYETILNFFNDRIKKQEEKIDIDYFNEQDIASRVETNMYKISKILPYINLKDIIDPAVIKENVWCFLYFYNVYLPKNRTNTENKNVFIELYDKIYDLTTEVMWIFIISNVFDYWILENFTFKYKKLLLNKWYTSYQVRDEIKKITTKEELQHYINKRFFWVKIFEKEIQKYFNVLVPDRVATKYASVEEGSLVGGSVDTEEEWEEGNDEKIEPNDLDALKIEITKALNIPAEDEGIFSTKELIQKAIDKGVLEKICEEILNENHGDSLKDLCMEYLMGKNKERRDEFLEKDDEIEPEFLVENCIDAGLYMQNLKGSKDVSARKMTITFGARKYLQQYLFDNYQLSGDPQKVINYLNRTAQGSFNEVFAKLKDKWCQKNLGFGLKTTNRRIEEHNSQQGQNDEKKIISIFDIKKENIDTIVKMGEQKENNMKHKIPGYFSQNELSNVLVNIFKENGKEVSAKTIKRRLKVLVQEGKINAPEKKKSGLYYKEEDTKKIYEALKCLIL